MRVIVGTTLTIMLAFYAIADSTSLDAAGTAKRAMVFVSPSGNDSTCARGNQARPCRSLYKALQVAAGGDLVLVANGTYGDQRLLYAGSPFARTGSTSRVTFRAQKRHGVTVGALELGDTSNTNAGRPASYVTFDGIDFDHMRLTYGDVSSGARGTFGTGITVENAKALSRTETEMDVRIGRDFLVRNVEIGPQCCDADAGIVVGSTYKNGNAYMNDGVTFDNVYIHDVAGDADSGRRGCADIPRAKWPNCSTEASPNTGNHTDCFQWGKGGRNITIKNSRFYNCHENNMGVNDIESGKEWFENVTFENNMFVNSKLYDLDLGAGVSSSDGFPAVKGSVSLLYNTWSQTPRVRDVAPTADVTSTGNIFSLKPPDCMTGTSPSDYRTKVRINSTYNMYSNSTCGSGDFVGSPTLVSTALGSEDGHLRAGSRGIGRGSLNARPRFDIDGHLRPLRMRPDVGASQREPASIVLGRSFGAIVLGEQKADVVAFYRQPHREVVGTARGHRVDRALYRIHRGTLVVTYDGGDRVVGISTSSPFYSTRGGLGVKALIPRGSSAHWGCRAFSRPNGTKVHIWRSRMGSIKRIAMFVSGYDSCPAR